MPTPILQNKSPFEVLFKKSPNYKFLHTFGSACWPNLEAYNSNKLQPRSLPCVFMGYSLHHKGYKCLHIPTDRIYFSRDAIFQEGTYSFVKTSTPNMSSSMSHTSHVSPPLSVNQHVYPAVSRVLSTSSHLKTSSSQPMDHIPTPVSSSPTSSSSHIPLNDTSSPLSPPPNPPDNTHANPMPLNSHHMMTWSKHQIFKPTLLPDGTTKYKPPHALLITTTLDEIELTCHSTAIRHPKWRAAMNTEFDALLKNHTWTLVPFSTAQNLIGCKWVF
jgi:hypothetical protein